MAALHKLNAAQIKAGLPPGWHSDGGGLYLFVDGSARWVFRYRWKDPGSVGDGKRKHMGLGPLRDVTLAQAREKARKARELLREHRDPMEVRGEGAVSPVTFSQDCARSSLSAQVHRS